MKKNTLELMVRSGNQVVYATGKLAKRLTIGIVAMFVMIGIAALVEVGNNRINLKKLNP